MIGQLSDFDLRLIRVFLAIVEAGGVSSAQATLNVGQSTISAQLATLETRLGYRLCERGRGGFALTPRGTQFVEAAREWLRATEAFGIKVRNVGRRLVGTLDIGLIGHTPLAENARISEAIERFRRRDEAVQLRIVVRPPGDLEEALLNGRVQVAVGYFWHRVPSLEYMEVFAERQVAYCGRAHPLFGRAGNVGANEAGEHAWAWRSYPLPDTPMTATPRIVTALADNMEAVAMLVLSGRHLGYLPEHFATPYVQQGLLTPLDAARLHYDVPFHLVTRARPHRSEVVDAFVDDMQAAHRAA